MATKALGNGDRTSLYPLLILGGLMAVLLWGYWNTLSQLARYWDNDKYSHGYIVPLFTLVLLWLRRDFSAPIDTTRAYIGAGLVAVAAAVMGATYLPNISNDAILGIELVSVQIGVVGALLLVQQPISTRVSETARWAGAGLVALGLGIRLLATYFPNITPDMYSFIPCVMGLFLMVGGWDLLRWAGAPLAFLIFMFPLPGFLDRGLLSPLQKLATAASTYCLQTLGVPAANELNKIALGEQTMEVVEACSGLRMLTIFVALAVAITMVTDRPIWERLVIIASAIPIALAVNIIRITVTGIMYLTVGPKLADEMFHAMAGWFMMPMALGLLYVEFQVLSHLFVDEGMAGPVPFRS